MALWALVLAALCVAGCQRTSSPRGPGSEKLGAARDADRFSMAVDTFFRAEEFETGEMLARSMDRLDQWIRRQKPLPHWKLDPMVARWAEPIGGLAKPIEEAANQLAEPVAVLELKDLVTRCQQLADAIQGSAQQLEGLRKRPDFDHIDRLAARLRGMVEQLGGSPRMRGQAVIDFLSRKIEEVRKQKEEQQRDEVRQLMALADRLADGAEMRSFIDLDTVDGRLGQLLSDLDDCSDQLKRIAAKRPALRRLVDELRRIEDQLQEGRKRRDVARLTAGLERLRAFAGAQKLDRHARRDDPQSLKALARQLSEPWPSLQAAVHGAEQLADRLGLGQLLLLAAHLQRIDQFRTRLGADLQELADSGSPDVWHRRLAESAAQAGALHRQVLGLVRPLEYLARLDELSFWKTDGFALQEAIWLRNVSRWAVGDEREVVSQAVRLFDWIVRNIQLDGEAPPDDHTERIMQRPWETLLLGHGTAEERAWVFVLLARQQGIDAVQLALPHPDGRLVPWAVGVLDGTEIYLFDPALGLPIPAPGGVELSPSGELRIRPATLSQVLEDDNVLRQLDLDRDNAYPVSAAQLHRVVALLEASPAYASRRMAMIERRLAGQKRVILTCHPAAQADRLRRCPQVAEIRLWGRPYQALLQNIRLGVARARWLETATRPFRTAIGGTAPLGRGRVLHLKGRFHESPSASEFYQQARIPNRELNHPEFDRQLRQICVEAKQHASYWLGLVAMEQRNYRSALDYLLNRVLRETPNGPWTHGAYYNAGRACEASGKSQQAIEYYFLDNLAPGYHGNLLRARWLASLASVAQPPTTAAGASEGEKPTPTTRKPSQEPILPGLKAPGRSEEPEIILPGLDFDTAEEPGPPSR